MTDESTDVVAGGPAERRAAEPRGDAQRFVLKPRIAASLLRYRISAFVVGVGLLILCATIVLKYGFDMAWTVEVWGPIHGVLYVIYVLLTFDIAYKAHWKLRNLLKVLLAGVVPVLSFYAEHWVTRKVRAGERL